MQLQIGTLPVDFPKSLRSHVRRFCSGFFPLRGRITPVRTDLKYFYTLALDSVPEIHLIANVLWRPTLFHERFYRFLAFLGFEFAKSHFSPAHT